MVPFVKPGFLERIGLHRPELRAWALYDWANSAFVLLVITAVFPIYYQTVAAAPLDPNHATEIFARVTGVTLAIVAIASPVMGAFADTLGIRKLLLGVFLGLGVISTGSMFFIHKGDWTLALILFAAGNFSIAATFVFYDALLPHIASREEMDKVSTAGYAIGYLGSGLLLIVTLAVIQMPDVVGFPDAGAATRASFIVVAVWWGIFSVPLFTRIKEPARLAVSPSVRETTRHTVMNLLQTFRELRTKYKQALRMLVALFVYNDGIGTIIRMATIFAASIELPQQDIIMAVILVQFVGIPATFLFGWLAGKIGTKNSILLGLGIYCVITLVGYVMTSALEFYVLAILVGLVQGGTQALSRSLFAGMIPRHKSTEFFGFFSVFEKFAGIFGPLIFSMMILMTGSTRDAVLSIALFFVVGGILLTKVRIEEGQEAARVAEEEFSRRLEASAAREGYA
ncbi:MAG: MFS transporter [Ignavibacteriales bacterium]|nr:MFS transporter [Ignavibacteriales bacterium]